MNTKQRTRTTTQLPEGIDPSEIPRNIWYIPPSETHGDRFVVEVKGIPDVGDICKKTTSSRTVSSKNKLEEAIKIRNDIFKKYPVLVEYSRDAPQSIRLKKEYENIIAIAKNETPPHFLEEPVMEPVELVEPVEPVKPVESVKVPKQWKTRDIYDFIKNNKEHHYKLYCEVSNDLSKLPTWNTMWFSFLEHVKGASWEIAEDLIRSFVEELRRIRHNSLCSAKKNVLDREDRQVWPAETVDKLFLEGRIHEFKGITEEYAGDNPADPKWDARWKEFVGSLQSATDTKGRIDLITKFMTAQRTKKYRRSKKT